MLLSSVEDEDAVQGESMTGRVTKEQEEAHSVAPRSGEVEVWRNEWENTACGERRLRSEPRQLASREMGTKENPGSRSPMCSTASTMTIVAPS
jgi:hypothetical protein